MQKVTAVIASLFQCAVFGTAYGATCSVVFVGIAAIADGIGHRNALYALIAFPVGVPYALMFGLPAGFIAGVIGGTLGGPFGWGIGGIVGPAVSLCLLLQHISLASALQVAIIPCLMGAAIGVVIGWDLRRREPTVIGGGAVRESVYRSPLGRWLGWRRNSLEAR